MGVEAKHLSFTAAESTWAMLRDFLIGEDAVKEKGETYLPKPKPRTDKEYLSYVQRASFYGATAKTVEALVGAIFRKEPKADLPPGLEYLVDDADGCGTPLGQQAKSAGEETLGMGRTGLLVDYPQVPELASRAEEMEQHARAQIFTYRAEHIRNWRYERHGGKNQLTLLVLEESVTVDGDDDFDPQQVTQLRELRLGEHVTDAGSSSGLMVRLWRQKDSGEWTVISTAFPRLPGNQPLTEIPFVFLGAGDLTAEVDKAPVEDIARVNRAHYRNSADYEEMLFMLGNPTPWVSGCTPEFIDKYKGKYWELGSRSAWMLPKDATAGLLEMHASPEHLLKAMAEKERQMAALGARLFEPRSGNVEAADTIRMRQTGEASLLASIASNISRAYLIALQWCADWMGESDPVEFACNADFFATRLTPQELTALMQAWQGGAITQQTLYEQLVAGEIIADGGEFDDYKSELEIEAPDIPKVSDEDMDDADD